MDGKCLLQGVSNFDQPREVPRAHHSSADVAAPKHQPLALVHSCSGGPAVAQLAADVAARLARHGLAELYAEQDLESLAGQALAGRPVIAVDGCSGACCTRMLEAKGIRPVSVIELSELGVQAGDELSESEREELVEKVLERLEASRPAATVRRRRPSPPQPAPRTKRAHTVSDYLLAIHALTSPVVACGAMVDSPTLAAHVSQALGVSRPSAGQMLERLEREGLIERSTQKEVLLAAPGREAAARAVRRHRVLECFAVGFLGFAPADAWSQARLLDDAFDDTMVELIAGRLGSPERCPHGWPLDPVAEREESHELVALSALGPGERAVIVRLAEHDGELLGWLYEHGLAPGAEIEVLAAEPAADRLRVRMDGALHDLAARATADVFVRVGRPAS